MLASPLSLADTHALFDAGRYSDIASALGASRTPAALRALRPEQRVLVAHALFHVGDEPTAIALITNDNHPDAPGEIRARCELIAGLLCRRRGDLPSARRHFLTSFQLATSGRDFRQAGWAALQHFRCCAETEPASSLVAALDDVRRRVALAADPHAAAYLHDAIALMETAAGRPEEARRHLRICRSLLDRHPNAWLEQVAHINAFHLDFVESRYASALRHIRLARRTLPLTGRRQEALIDCNEGHALLAAGRFADAIARFRTIADTRTGPPAIAALDGLARAYLATDQLDACEATLGAFDVHTSTAPVLRDAFAGRWTLVARAKLRLRRGPHPDTPDAIATDITHAERLHDRLLASVLGCLHAEALASAGDTAASAHALLHASTDAATRTPDALGAWYRAAAVVLAHAGHPLADAMFARADALWRQHRHRCATAELTLVRAARPAPSEPSPEPSPDPSSDPAPDPASRAMTAVTHLGSACELAYNGHLLGREILQALHLLDCAPDAQLVDLPVDASSPPASRGRVVLELGDAGARRVALTCRTPGDPGRAVLLAGVLRIAEAAVALEQHRREERARAALWPARPVETDTGALFFADRMREVVRTARQVAAHDVPVLLTGETGTGKEVIARLIHAHSPRAKAVFLPFNCAATPKEMLDSQLFGHRRGAFTGAADSFPGVIRAAMRGTLFLDEIGETTPDVQPKLLRFLESSEVHTLGDARPTAVDVRVLAATNADLPALIAQGRFREDLFYRLNIVPIHLPPLRERRVEIPALAVHYLRRFAQEFRRGELRLAEETTEHLLLYRWPGNVRQLANEMRRLAALAEPDAILMPEHLSPSLVSPRRVVSADAQASAPTEVVVRLDQPLAAGVGHLERAMIQYALAQCGGRLEETAALLGLSRKGLYLKRQRYGLDPAPEAELPFEGV